MTAPMTTSVRRVAIVEDHGALRIFLRDVLTQLGWKVTGVAGTAESGCELVARAPSPTSPSSICTSPPRAAATR